MSNFVGGAKGGVVPNADSFSPEGSIFPHLRLSPSGPVIPGNSILDFQFAEAFGTATFDLNQVASLPPSQADQLASFVPANTDDPSGPILSISFNAAKVGSIIALWYSFGFEAPAGESAFAAMETLIAMQAPASIGTRVLSGATGGAIQSSAVAEQSGAPTAIMGSILFAVPVVVPGDYNFFPVAYSGTGGGVVFMAPPTNQVAIAGILIGPN